MTEMDLIVIPANPADPIRKETTAGDYRDFQRLVGGTFEVTEIDNPHASLYINDNGLNMGLERNMRASMLIQVHSELHRIRPFWVVGDVVMVGPADEDGEDLPIPPEYMRLLLEASSFRVRIKRRSSSKWVSEGELFEDVWDAYETAWDIVMSERDTDARVLPIGER